MIPERRPQRLPSPTLGTRDTEDFAAALSRPRLHHGLAAPVADHGVVDLRGGRERDGGLFDPEELFGRRPQHFLRGEPLAGLAANTDGAPRGAEGEDVDVLAVVAEVEVALAECAAGDHLDGVDGARVVLDDRDQLLVLGALGPQAPEADLCGAVAHHDAAAEMAVELDDLFELPRESLHNHR